MSCSVGRSALRMARCDEWEPCTYVPPTTWNASSRPCERDAGPEAGRPAAGTQPVRTLRRSDDLPVDRLAGEAHGASLRIPAGGNRATLSSVSDLSEHAVATRVPSLVDEKLKSVSRRDPVTVAPGTSLAECLRAIQRTGTGDSVFVTHPDGRLAGVLTERDIFGRLVGGDVDLAQPVETLMTVSPHHLHFDETVRD